MRWLVALAVLVAACSSGGASLGDLHLPKGYADLPTEEGEPAAFRALYREATGAEEVQLHRVDTPPDGGPPLVVVRLRWDGEGPDPAELAGELEEDVPIAGGRARSVAGRPAFVREADPTFRSVVLVVDGDEGVLVYGGLVADEERVAVAAIG